MFFRGVPLYLSQHSTGNKGPQQTRDCCGGSRSVCRIVVQSLDGAEKPTAETFVHTARYSTSSTSSAAPGIRYFTSSRMLVRGDVLTCDSSRNQKPRRFRCRVTRNLIPPRRGDHARGWRDLRHQRRKLQSEHYYEACVPVVWRCSQSIPSIP
jgi:hypothetical protein